MKKKQITSKLDLKKTTIVSFKDMGNIIGGTMVNTDTVPISQHGVSCQTLNDCHTQEGQATCASCTGDDCNTSNTTRTTITLNGCVSAISQKNSCVRS